MKYKNTSGELDVTTAKNFVLIFNNCGTLMFGASRGKKGLISFLTKPRDFSKATWFWGAAWIYPDERILNCENRPLDEELADRVYDYDQLRSILL